MKKIMNTIACYEMSVEEVKKAASLGSFFSFTKRLFFTCPICRHFCYLGHTLILSKNSKDVFCPKCYKKAIEEGEDESIEDSNK